MRARPTPQLSGLRVEQLKSGFTVFSIGTFAADCSLWRILTGALSHSALRFLQALRLHKCASLPACAHSDTASLSHLDTCSRAGRRFELVIQDLMLDWTTDGNGASHTANVLSDAGFIRLSKPEPKAGTSEAAPEGALCSFLSSAVCCCSTPVGQCHMRQPQATYHRTAQGMVCGRQAGRT